jgi:agmatine deiminase
VLAFYLALKRGNLATIRTATSTIWRGSSTHLLLCDAFEDNVDDADYEALKENYDLLCKSTDQDGKPLRIIKLPMPKVESDEGYRLPASYTNFYIGNTKVLVPVFDHPNDAKALAILQELFPTRKVVGIAQRPCVWLRYAALY